MEECVKEILKGLHMGVLGIEHVVDKIDSEGLRRLVVKQKKEYESLIQRVHAAFPNVEDKEPGMISESMIEMKTMFASDNDIVKMLMKGCNNAVISMTEVIHSQQCIDAKLKSLADDVEDVSKNYEEQLKSYL
jgi:hypothetical protein